MQICPLNSGLQKRHSPSDKTGSSSPVLHRGWSGMGMGKISNSIPITQKLLLHQLKFNPMAANISLQYRLEYFYTCTFFAYHKYLQPRPQATPMFLVLHATYIEKRLINAQYNLHLLHKFAFQVTPTISVLHAITQSTPDVIGTRLINVQYILIRYVIYVQISLA